MTIDYGFAGEKELVKEQGRGTPYPAYTFVKILHKPYIFILPRKSASCSMRDVLSQMSNFSSEKTYLSTEALRAHSAPRIAVIRHPVDRAVSAWRHGTTVNDGSVFRGPGIRPHMPWAEFVDAICATSDADSNFHYRSQSDEIFVDRLPDHMLRVDWLADDWRALSKKLGWPVVEIRQLNKTVPVKIEITNEQRERLSVRYAKDFSILNGQGNSLAS